MRDREERSSAERGHGVLGSGDGGHCGRHDALEEADAGETARETARSKPLGSAIASEVAVFLGLSGIRRALVNRGNSRMCSPG